MVLTKRTYNNQDKYKKPKDIHNKPQKLNCCGARLTFHVMTLGKFFTHMCLCSPSSVTWYWHKLELNRHSTRHTSPVFVDLQLGMWLRATKTEISAALWVLVAGERL